MAAVLPSTALTPMKKKLLSMSKPALIKSCKKYSVSTLGTKKEMITRILHAKALQDEAKKSKKKKKKKKKADVKPDTVAVVVVANQPQPPQAPNAKADGNAAANIAESPIQLENSVTDEVKEETHADVKQEEQKQAKQDDESKDEEKDPKQIFNQRYIDAMKELKPYGIYSPVEGLCDRSSFSSHKNDPVDPKSANLRKILVEIRKDLPKNIYTSVNGSMFVRFDGTNPRFIQALLTGIEHTPYANGMFLFDIYLPTSYPQTPCEIKHITNGAHLCHANNGPGGFSPNLHQSTGKVCLSLLGTWQGPGWQAGKSNVYQVLSSLLFMVFGAKHPYYMEPGFGGWEGNALKKKKHEKKVWEYTEEVMYHNVKYAMLQTLQNPYKGFEDVIKTHFKVKGDVILETVHKWMKHKKFSAAFKSKMKPVYASLEQEIKKL